MIDDIYQAVFTVAEALELPVVLLALAALAAVIYETGAFVVERIRRHRRSFPELARAAAVARAALHDGDRASVEAALVPVAWSRQMAGVLTAFAREAGKPGSEPRLAKQLADFDFDGQRRLSRTRLLVRFGPALGLMGTLIPLSPALEGLANGDVETLADNLRLAFSITVLGLLVGAAAFALSLARDRIYAQDHSDLEYVAAVLTDPAPDPSSQLSGEASA
ncbi:MotA/TolQ/ExbB proton channel family protein [Nocardioides sp.]|uniref:MotA/TolQ/ExbB proton channel family protein n=1 Tax=Nocardioides sp. TaxID=35761 RepID=UPI0039E59632